MPPTSDFLIFRKMSIFGIFLRDLGSGGGLQSIGNGCGLQIDGFSAQTEPYGSIFDDFHDFGDFGIVFGGLTLLPEGFRTLRECPEVPGPYESVLPNWSGLVWTSRDLSRLVQICRH